ncbi:alpha-glucosidase [Zobellia uliginosa]|uniref:Alpha-glucosidase n=1 Tax=Zobellia uliginosa TaxID=143224 RepID=A0ABY1KZC9_9FLAO|nr:glycoside hydrolase family 97 N-terminal domain-containing protein [Zobellia uliginosa]SIS83076.1 alpha-glucosidase [Zobellia uliginosa]
MKNKKWLIRGWILFVTSLTKACKKSTHTFILKSPDQSIALTLANTDGLLSYSIFRNGQQRLKNSALSIFPNTKVKVMETKVTSLTDTLTPVWGQFSKIQDTYNELGASLDYEGVPATLYIRAYDGGSTFRFVTDDFPIAKKPAFFIEYGLSATDKTYMPAGEHYYNKNSKQ